MNDKNYDLICFGEILWDIFPDGRKVIGGAPLNVAIRAHSYGLNVSIISRLGRDEMASKIRDYMQSLNLDFSLVQEDNDWETGSVLITLDAKGIAHYEIKKPSAWDYIKPTENNVEAVEGAKVFLFGSLAARNEVSKKTLLRLIEKANIKVFDVNLRPPDYSADLLIELLNLADVAKFNDEELEEVCQIYKIKFDDLNKAIGELSLKSQTSTICVTKGSKGAVLFHENEIYEHQGYSVEVEDTVGAGDSFLATLITELLVQNKTPEEALKNACAIGAIVASKKGANPEISISDIMSIKLN